MTPYDADVSALTELARKQMNGAPVWFEKMHAWPLLEQFQETATFRQWVLHAVAIMRNHIHIVVEVPDDPEPETLLQSFKSYGSRRLNSLVGKPPNGTWWTRSGSTRKLPDDRAILAAIRYVGNQQNPLVIWLDPRWTPPNSDSSEPGQ